MGDALTRPGGPAGQKIWTTPCHTGWPRNASFTGSAGQTQLFRNAEIPRPVSAGLIGLLSFVPTVQFAKLSNSTAPRLTAQLGIDPRANRCLRRQPPAILRKSKIGSECCRLV